MVDNFQRSTSLQVRYRIYIGSNSLFQVRDFHFPEDVNDLSVEALECFFRVTYIVRTLILRNDFLSTKLP